MKTKNKGYTRKEIVEHTGIKEGGTITELLNALVSSDFVITYTPFGESKKNTHYKLVDPFCIFFLRFVEGKDSLNRGNIWLENLENPSVSVFKGLAFENVCFNHIRQIKKALGISNVSTRQSIWIKEPDETEGFQIDLVIERKDNIVNICEAKFYNDDFSVSKDYFRTILRRQNLISPYIGKKCTIRNTLITTFGLKRNEYSSIFSDVITLDDLFEA